MHNFEFLVYYKKDDLFFEGDFELRVEQQTIN
jgi:hypothetical protein